MRVAMGLLCGYEGCYVGMSVVTCYGDIRDVMTL